MLSWNTPKGKNLVGQWGSSLTPRLVSWASALKISPWKFITPNQTRPRPKTEGFNLKIPPNSFQQKHQTKSTILKGRMRSVGPGVYYLHAKWCCIPWPRAATKVLDTLIQRSSKLQSAHLCFEAMKGWWMNEWTTTAFPACSSDLQILWNLVTLVKKTKNTFGSERCINSISIHHLRHPELSIQVTTSIDVTFPIH